MIYFKMEFSIQNKARNDLLNREDITAVVVSETSPKTEEVKTAIAQQTNKDAELVVVKRVKGKFGSKEFLVEAEVYDNLESLRKFNRLSKKEEEKKKKEQPVPAAGEEKKTEDKKEIGRAHV